MIVTEMRPLQSLHSASINRLIWRWTNLSPNRGIDSLVSGIFSAMASMKTLKARMTVTPRAIFSPESGGRQNTSTVRDDIIMHGNTMLYMK